MKRVAFALVTLSLLGATAPAFADCPAHASNTTKSTPSKGT